MRSRSTASLAAMSASSTRRWRSISASRVARSIAIRACGHLALLRDAGGLGRLAGGDVGLVNGPLAGDLASLDVLLAQDPRRVERLFLGDPRRLDGLASGDLGRLGLLPGTDPGLGDLALLAEARGLDDLFGRDLGFVDGPTALDLEPAHFALGGDARLGDLPLVADPGGLDRLAAEEGRGLGLASRARRVRGRPRRAGRRGRNSISRSCVSRAASLSRSMSSTCFSACRLRAADQDRAVLLDVVAQLAPRLDRLDHRCQTLGVEAVRGIEDTAGRSGRYR